MRPLTCSRDCARHREHLYVLCYGHPVTLRQADTNQPVTHYVGYTTQQPPIMRVWDHGKGSTAALTGICPGNLRDELRAKLTGRCPRCHRSLWYYPQAPTPDDYARARLYVNSRDNCPMRLHYWSNNLGTPLRHLYGHRPRPQRRVRPRPRQRIDIHLTRQRPRLDTTPTLQLQANNSAPQLAPPPVP